MIPVKLNFDVDFTFRFLALASSSSSWNVYPELRAFFRILLHRLYRYRIKGWLSLSRTLLISLEVEDSMCREESRSNTPVIRDESSITQSIFFLPGTQSSDCTGSLNNSIIFDFSSRMWALAEMEERDYNTLPMESITANPNCNYNILWTLRPMLPITIISSFEYICAYCVKYQPECI